MANAWEITAVKSGAAGEKYSAASVRRMTSKVEEVEVARLRGQARQWLAASW